MMNGSASAGFGREIRRVCRGVRTTKDNAAVGFRRKLGYAINHNKRNVHAAAAPGTTAIVVFNGDIPLLSSLGAESAGLDGPL
jgi:hypothetical protein